MLLRHMDFLMSHYLVHVHDHGDTEICKISFTPMLSTTLRIYSRDELMATLREYGLGERDCLDAQLQDAGDANPHFPWVRIY